MPEGDGAADGEPVARGVDPLAVGGPEAVVAGLGAAEGAPVPAADGVGEPAGAVAPGGGLSGVPQAVATRAQPSAIVVRASRSP
ncbi:hypothetical protein SAMN04488543_0363 [Friedmanniella luteola]|uniref:Uncharacterized protein n=1 Tax=Friedmanniella luteola TaxID=546871 RepID=A0A1H1LP26_9ACTN|nr:hypothetical protein [Friedmanniella luteola]SDR76127.1 hypothetical protein SAMN04488543_0363 [Friedmanniella luteola]